MIVNSNQADALAILDDQGTSRGTARRYEFAPGMRLSQILPRKSGIYILEFDNGEAYVGKAKDVVRRSAQHRDGLHTGYTSLCFLEVQSERLDAVERDTVAACENAGLRLRNLTYASFNYKPGALDKVVEPAFFEDFVRGAKNDLSGQRQVEPELRDRYSARNDEFRKHPCYEQITSALSRYVAACVPAPIKTEIGYWSVTCLPQRGTHRILACINVHWQEVLFLVEEEGEIWIVANVSASSLVESGDLLAEDVEKSGYVDGGADQCTLEVPLDEFDELLAEPAFIAAARAFNVRLMRKGKCNFGRWHSLGLADALLS